MNVGDMIKVHLPGERLWAEVVAMDDDGSVHVELRNESIHQGISWGDRAVLGSDRYEIVEPKSMVTAAEESCAIIREELQR